MLVTADDVGRSLRGVAELLDRRDEALHAFDVSERGFWRSFGAIWLTLPVLVVALALERYRLGLLQPGAAVIDASRLTAVVAVGQIAFFLSRPLAMIRVTRWLGVETRYVAFVVVTNWVTAAELTILSVPALLLVLGLATPGLAILYTAAFAVVVLRIRWAAARIALGISGGIAAVIVGMGLCLDVLIAGSVGALAG